MSASISGGVSDFGYRFIFACWTVGMTLGSLVIARRVRPAALAAGALAAVGRRRRMSNS
jgi:hypothetical protein